MEGPTEGTDAKRGPARRRRPIVGVAAAALLLLTALALSPIGERVLLLVEQRQAVYPYYADVYAWLPEGRVERISPGDGVFYQPCVHPDGTRALYAGAAKGPPRLWEADIASGARTALTPATSAALHPTYSHDGSQIAFCSDRASDAPATAVHELKKGGRPIETRVLHLFVMDASSGDTRRITDGPHGDYRPSFSPDGKTLVFVSDRGGTDALWTVPVDGASPPQPLWGERPAMRPCFSRDGSEVFFHTTGPVPHRLLRVPVRGGPAEPVLADGPFDMVHGAFADPGGEVLLVHARADGRWGIWEIALDGGEPRPLVPPGFAEAYHPSRSRTGVLVFDLPRETGAFEELWQRLLQ